MPSIQSNYDEIIDGVFNGIISETGSEQDKDKDKDFRTFEGEFKPYFPVRDDVGDAGVSGV